MACRAMVQAAGMEAAMAWRKWLVRGLVFFVICIVAAAVFLYERWTNPAAVRQQVLQQMVQHFPGATVALESAHLRLLGGIAITDLRLARRDDPNRIEFAYFPSGIIYHDKEQLVQGRLAIRKLELDRPRIHVRRGRDGRWNLKDITGPLTGEQIPTIVVTHGTLVVLDGAARLGGTSIELSDVNLTVLNDPISTVRFQGSARSDIAGPVSIRGSWDRNTDETELSVDAGRIGIAAPLLERLRAYAPEVADHIEHLQGTCDVQADFGYHPGAPRPWTHDIHCELVDGRLVHPRLPLPLDHVNASLHCADGRVTVDRVTAQAGQAQLRLTKAHILSLGPAPDMDGTLEIEHLPLTSELFAGRLPGDLAKIKSDYAPAGAISLNVEFSHRQGQWIKHCWLHPEDMTMCFCKFPYPLQHIGGTLEQRLDPTLNLDVLKLDLVGFAGQQRVYIQGTVSGDGPETVVDVHVYGRNIALDHTLQDALAPAQQKLAEQFHPSGLADIDAHIARSAGTPEYRDYIIVKFHDATERYDIFPYPLEHVSGTLDIRPGGWRFYDFHGEHNGLKVTCSGRSESTPRGDGFSVELRGQNMRLDDELARALDPDLKPTWIMLAPSGQMHFDATVQCEPNQDPDLDVRLTAAGCAICPAFFPYRLNDMTGAARFTKRRVTALSPEGPHDYSERKISLDDIVAHHGSTRMTVEHGVVELDPKGDGVYVKLKDLQGTPLVPDTDLLRALPEKMRQVIEGVHLHDPVTLRTQLVVRTFASEEHPPTVWWDGQIRMHDATLSAGVTFEHLTGSAACCGDVRGPVLEGLVGDLLFQQATVYSQPFSDIHASLAVRPRTSEILEMPRITAQLFGGNVGGQARFEFSASPSFVLNLTAAKIRLEEFGRHNLARNTPLSGEADARLWLRGKGESVQELTGGGSVEVEPKSKLYNLPLLLDLLKVLGLRRPDGVAFEEAHVDFSIRGPRVIISQVDLFGNSFSLRGQGEMNLNGTDIDLNFYAVWAQAVQMLPPVIKEIPEAISKQLLKIKMRGRVGDVQCTKEPVPALVEPLQAFLQGLSGRERRNRSLPPAEPDGIPPAEMPRAELPPRDLGK